MLLFISNHVTLCFFPKYLRRYQIQRRPNFLYSTTNNNHKKVFTNHNELGIVKSTTMDGTNSNNNEAQSSIIATEDNIPFLHHQKSSLRWSNDTSRNIINSASLNDAVINTWYKQYFDLMTTIMKQDRSMTTVRRKGKSRLSYDEIHIVQEYLLKLPNVLDNNNEQNHHSLNNESNVFNNVFNFGIQSGTTFSSSSNSSVIRQHLLKNRHTFWYEGSDSDKTFITLKEQESIGRNSKNNSNDIVIAAITQPILVDEEQNKTIMLFRKPDLQSDYAFCCLSYIIDVCAREAIYGPCFIAWFKMMECGMIPRENCVSAILYVLSSFLTTSKVSSSSSKSILLLSENTHNNIDDNNDNNLSQLIVEEDLISKACLDVATFHDMLYEPNEKTITLRIKRLLADNDVIGAEQILSSLPDKERIDDDDYDDIILTKKEMKKKMNKKVSSSPSDWKRLRTYQPILAYYCTDVIVSDASTTMSIVDKTTSALRLFLEMRISNGVNLDNETYAMLICALTKRGCFFPPKNIMKEDDSYDVSHDDVMMLRGPALFDYIATEMSNDILELDEVSANNIYNSFVEGYEMYYKCNIVDQLEGNMCHVLELQTKESSYNTCRLIIGRVTVDQETSICSMTGAKLRLFALNESQRLLMHDTLLKMAAQQHEDFGEKILKLKAAQTQNNNNKKIKNVVTDIDNVILTTDDQQQPDSNSESSFVSGAQKDGYNETSTTAAYTTFNGQLERDGRYAYEQLHIFSEWLRGQQSDIADADGLCIPRYTVIVDGPNVAYFGHGDIHYSQIQKVVDVLEQMGESPLVIMPQKYVSDKFWLSSGRVQELSEQDKNIRETLLAKEQMYVVPIACLDDYYWMLASVAYSKESNALYQQMIAPVPNNNVSSRFPGLRPLLITNDQMRDHKLSLLHDPRSFRRWTSCHIVKYTIELYQNSEWEERNITFVPADFFSREIQGNSIGTIPSPSRSDNHETGTAWHIPVTGWEDPQRLCISIVQ